MRQNEMEPESREGTVMPDVMTVTELAKRLRIGRSSAYGLVSSGEVRSIRVGRVIRIPAAAVDDFLSADPGTATDVREWMTQHQQEPTSA